jgi:hypothetical protein
MKQGGVVEEPALQEGQTGECPSSDTVTHSL